MILPCRHLHHYLYALAVHPLKLSGYNYDMKIKKGESHIQRAYQIIQSFGGDTTVNPYLKVSDQLLKSTEQHLSRINDPIICLFIGGRWKTKTYANISYQVVIEYILRHMNSSILLLGNQKVLFNELNFQSERVINLCGETSIQEVISYIARSDLAIGPDGGLLNIAMALNKKVIGMFGPVDPKTIVSEKYSDQIIYKKKCQYQPCYNEDHEPFCPYSSPLCMEIDPEDIILEIKKRLLN